MKKILLTVITLLVAFTVEAQQLTPPHYPGGKDAFHVFLSKNLKWPNNTSDVQGSVVIGFCVEINGRLTDFKVIKSLGYGFDKEALRVIKLSGRWIPAMRNNSFIKSKFTVPIQFILKDND